MDKNKISLRLDDVGEFLAKFTEYSDHVYWISSPDFKRIIYISPSYERIWGRPRKELYQDPEIWISFLHPDDVVNHHPIHEMAEKIKTLGEKARYTENYRIIKPNGDIRWIMDNGFPLYDYKGTCYGVTGIAIDVTEQKEQLQALKEAKEKAEAANQAKTEFLENMRHDIRTPLTGIVGFADLLKLESDKPQLADYADNLVASSHALLDFLDEVLEAIRVSSGEIPMLKKKFCLKDTLQQVIDLNRAKSAQKNLSLTLEIDPHLPPFLIGDKVRIHRVVLELIANALNFTDSGFVKLAASLAKKNQRNLVLKLTITDSGIGIPKEKQEEIYMQFKRLTPSYKNVYKGLGLGLSVVKQFIDEMDAEIYVESDAQKGSCFTCLIPLQKPLLEDSFGIDEDVAIKTDKPFEITVEQQLKTSEQKQEANRVLVVEDNIIAQSVSKSILSRLNCAVDLAETGQTALEMWKTTAYSLIFMDIGLPDMDGYEVTYRIRVQEIAYKTHVPIIALTAHVGDENKKRCMDAGMNAVFAKPLTFKNASDILDTFIPRRQKEPILESVGSLLPLHQSELFNLNAFPLLDVEDGINTLGTRALLKEMLQFATHENLPKEREELQNAYNASDWNKLQQLAHKVKGGAEYTGSTRLKKACLYLEQYLKSEQTELVDRLYSQLIAVIEDSLKENSTWLME